jgi:trimethyllysine dioxygenase
VSEIAALLVADHGLTVRWSNGGRTDVPWPWVRDHDCASLHPSTMQRLGVVATVVGCAPGVSALVDGADIVVVWADGHATSRLPVALLASVRSVGADDDVAFLWDALEIADAWPTVAYGDVIAGDEGVAAWLANVHRFGFCMVTETPVTIEATEALLRRVGYVRHTIFGGMWDFQADMSKADTAYTNLELLPHTDGTYSHDAPGLQLLHCLEFDGDGGMSTMVDGFRAAAELRAADADAYELLSHVHVPGHYLGDGVHLRAERPVLRHDTNGRLLQVSFNNADRAPFLLPADEHRRFYDALARFEALVNDRRLQWRRRNPPGEAMLFDNWRVLHGRTAYSGRRRLCGGYVNREDYESRRRMLAAVAGPV